jgi:hypothetical protein
MIKSVEKIYTRGNFNSYKMNLENNEFWSVPLDPANTDYQAIQKWIAEGGEVIDNPPNE